MTNMSISALGAKLKSRFRYGQRIDPSRDWLVLLSVSGIILAVIVVWNVWAFDTVSKGDSIGAPVETGAPLFNQASLNELNAMFSARASEEQKYQSGAYTFTDPSH